MQQIGNILFLDSVDSGVVAGESATYIMYKNAMSTATVLQGGDVATLYDKITSIFYKLTSGIHTLEFQLPSATVINCFAIAGANLQSASASLSFYLWDADTTSYYLATTFVNGRDNQPAMIVFDNQVSTKVKIEITVTSDFNLGELAFGEALKMPVTPSVGYRPARWNNDDEVTHLTTQSNNVGRSTVNKKAAKEVLPFKLINHTWMRSIWAGFLRDAKGLPIWVGWNQLEYPSECVYGTWQCDESSYSSPLYSSINLTISGNF